MKINVKSLCKKVDAYIKRKQQLERKKKEELIAQAKQDYADLAKKAGQIKELLPVIERIRIALQTSTWMPNLQGGVTLNKYRYFGGDFGGVKGVYFDLLNGYLGTHSLFNPSGYNGYYTKPDDFIENWCFRTDCHGESQTWMLEKLHKLVSKADEFIQCVVNNVDNLDHEARD